MSSLEAKGEAAEAALLQVLQNKPSVEVRRRVERLLEKLETPISSPEQLQALRALEVVERIGTTEARRILERLAQGSPADRLTQEAKAGMARLAKRYDSAR